MTRTRRWSASVAGSAAALAGLTVLGPTPVQAAGPGLVVAEVYGGGNDVGAAFSHDFVELLNTGAEPVALGGLSVQYRAAAEEGPPVDVVVLPAVDVPPGQTFLVSGAGGEDHGSPLPATDATSTLALDATEGQVFLADTVDALDPGTGDISDASVLDFVGWGSATGFETTPAPATTSASSITRDGSGTDADDNASDFTVAEPPTPLACTGCAPTPPVAVADIQGDGPEAAMLGETVTTTGVVTATYATGGLDGFYLQTAGSGGEDDATPEASDAIFVYAGPGGIGGAPAPGHAATVTGVVDEADGVTRLDVTGPGASVTDDGAGIPIEPRPGPLPGTDCALPGDECLTGVALAAAQEAHEGELWQPSGDFTVTDAEDGSAFGGASWPGVDATASMLGEVGLAADSVSPLVAPTDVIDAQATEEIADRVAYNRAHAVVLDDASITTYWDDEGTGEMATPMPWWTPTNPVRVGASVTFGDPVIYTEGGGVRRLRPTEQVTGDGSAQGVTFDVTRPAAPGALGGELKLATFDVGDYFTTSAAEYVALDPDDHACTPVLDRDGLPVAVASCTPDGPLGAWDATSLARQQAKIVHAINAIDADVVALGGIENSVRFGQDRDDSLEQLVAALNDDAGESRWAFVASPGAGDLPPTAGQDVLRTAFIYDPETVTPTGDSDVLLGSAAFADAREPLAQEFRIPGASAEDEAFGVIVNDFTTRKGEDDPDPDGQGNANDDRVAQAEALLDFADDFGTARALSRLYLAGDFEALGEEDPVQVIERGQDDVSGTLDDWTRLEDQDGDPSVSMAGLSGSTDHVFANAAAVADVTGVDVVDLNAAESVFGRYSRFHANARDLVDVSTMFASAEHNPVVVGLVGPRRVNIQVLGINDFHGRIVAGGSLQAGAAVLAGAVKQLRHQNPHTVFAAAGDLIGASTLDSFVQDDQPTLDALNAAGLDVSAAGSHELDAGYDDLTGRVAGAADWPYLAANLQLRSNGSDALAPSWTTTMRGVKVGFIGAVTEHLPDLVSAPGIAAVEVTDIVAAVNEEADALDADGADVIVLLVNEGAPSTSCAAMDDDPTSDFGAIVTGASPDIDAIVSGRSHLTYDCQIPVPAWVGGPVEDRPVVSSGAFGTALNRLVFTVTRATGEVQAVNHSVVSLMTGSLPNYPADPATQAVVTAAQAFTDGQPALGQIAGKWARAKFSNGSSVNRGGESTVGNLVAEAQRWATSNASSGAAQIALVNPGLLLADLDGAAGGYPKPLTLRQAAAVQPAANPLVNLRLTGAQLKATLEQQWQPTGASRPFLKLGISHGLVYTYDPARPAGSRITGIWLNGTPIDPSTTYSVTTTTALAGGADNFTALLGGTSRKETGKTDLQALVDYLDAAMPVAAPMAVDYSQRAVGVSFPATAPASYPPGSHVTFSVSSLAMTDPGDARDSTVSVSLGGAVLGAFPVTVAVPASSESDEAGTAVVDVVVPAGTPAGTATLIVTAPTTGTVTRVPIQVSAPTPTPTQTPTKTATKVSGPKLTYAYGIGAKVKVTVSPASASGQVAVSDKKAGLLGAAKLVGGKGTLALWGSALKPGKHSLTLKYSGDGSHGASTGKVTVSVAKANSKAVIVAPKTLKRGVSTALQIKIRAKGVKASGQVTLTIKGGKTYTAKVKKGRATFHVVFAKAGQTQLVAKYRGSALVAKGSGSLLVRVG